MIKGKGIIIVLLLVMACGNEKPEWYNDAINRSETQYRELVAQAGERGRYPRSIETQGETKWVGTGDWTSGYFPGSLWYLFELTGNEAWRSAAEELTKPLAVLEFDSTTHDIGLMLYCSFGNEYRLNKNSEDAQLLMNGANSLAKRFNVSTQCIRSWDFGSWQYPVIIDNMMNLEVLLWASDHSGDERYKNIAVAHANTTMQNHFRDDFSSYHVVDYDTLTGDVISHETFQGYSDSSAWSRGQAWGLYGYTVMYRATKEEKYLEQAENIASFFLSHPNLPEDKIPYWDFNAPGIPDEPRDAAAAAIAASGLLELGLYSKNRENYFQAAEEILRNLSSSKYLAARGENNHFILKHSTGSKPHDSEVDVPLNYADYYFLEGVKRYTRIKDGDKDILR